MEDINEPFLLLSAMPREKISTSGTLIDGNIANSTVLYIVTDLAQLR